MTRHGLPLVFRRPDHGTSRGPLDAASRPPLAVTAVPPGATPARCRFANR